MTMPGRRTAVLLGIVAASSLCRASVRVDTCRTDVELTSKDAGSHETALGDLVADALRATGHVDAAFIAASDFNEVTIAKGSFSTADLVKALRYGDNEVVVVKLSGDQLRKALERGFYLYPQENTGYLQFSGLTVAVNPDPAAQSRIKWIKIGGDPVDAHKTYMVAMPSPLANGALAYFKIWKKADIDRSTGKSVEVAVTEYLSAHKAIARGEDRLVAKE